MLWGFFEDSKSKIVRYQIISRIEDQFWYVTEIGDMDQRSIVDGPILSSFLMVADRL